MHVKCRQGNLYRMTWYIGMCGSNIHGLTIYASFYGQMCVLYEGFYWFRDHGAAIPNGLVIIGQTSLVGVGHPR